MQLAYYVKNLGEWHHIITAPIDNKAWNEQDIWVCDSMLDNGKYVVTIGYTMWQLI